MEEILVPLGAFTMVVAIVYILARRKERLALIQQGVDASILRIDKESNSSLKFGLLLIGIAVGILLGNLFANTSDLQEEVAYFSMTFICGGISLLIYYIMMKKQAGKNDPERKNANTL